MKHLKLFEEFINEDHAKKGSVWVKTNGEKQMLSSRKGMVDALEGDTVKITKVTGDTYNAILTTNSGAFQGDQDSVILKDKDLVGWEMNESVIEALNPMEFENAVKNLAYSMPNHTKYDTDGLPSDEQIMKAMQKYQNDLYRHTTTDQKKEAVEMVKQILSESVINEANISSDAIKKLADEIHGELYTAKLKGNSVTVKATTTTQTWDDGVPVLKYLARGTAKSTKFEPANPNVKIVHDYAHGWFYFTDFRKWYGLHQEDGYNEIEDLPFIDVKVTESKVDETKHRNVNEAARLDRDPMMSLLADKYGFETVRTTEEFNGNVGGIWVSGENGETLGGKKIYNYYGSGAAYELGVLKKFEQQIQKNGWYSEWYDAGTVMLWPL